MLKNKKLSTTHEILEDKKICSYCGKECKKESEFEGRHETDYFSCDCEGAKLELELAKTTWETNLRLQDLMREGDKILNKRRYKDDLRKAKKALKNKYSIED